MVECYEVNSEQCFCGYFVKGFNEVVTFISKVYLLQSSQLFKLRWID